MDEEDVSPTELVVKLSLSELNLIRLQHDEDMTQRFFRFTVYIYQNKSGRLHIRALTYQRPKTNKQQKDNR